MNERDVQRLRELLGPELSEEEFQQILREDPDLSRGAEHLSASFLAIQQETIPGLNSDFSDKVMAKVRRPLILGWLQDFLTLPRLALASGISAAVLAALWLGPRFWRETPTPGLLVREAIGPNKQKTYFVRFAIRQRGASSVSVAGDFNQWSPTPLEPMLKSEGFFSLEIPLSGGTYSYAFLIDGKKWMPDPTADRIVDDGFGTSNSLINL